MQGWIKLHRKVKGHWLFKEKRTFTKFEAWIDLLLEVNHKDNKFMLGGELIEVKRGQTITSIRHLCDRWGWSNTKVTKFLKMLEIDEMLTVKSDTKKTAITIANYEFYQLQDTEETTLKRHTDDSEATQKHTNKNDKNVKNENKKDSRPKRVYDESSIPYQLADLFYKQILTNNPEFKCPDLQTWADEIRKMMEIDKRTQDQISYLIKWVQQDEFEMANVLSPGKLRKRYDQLVLKVKRGREKSQPKKDVNWEDL